LSDWLRNQLKLILLTVQNQTTSLLALIERFQSPWMFEAVRRVPQDLETESLVRLQA